MLIVLEGVNGGGKDHLIGRLTDDVGSDLVTTLHQGPPPAVGNLVRHYEDPLHDPDILARICSPDHLVLFNRWEAGELVYGPLLRGGSRLTTGQAFHVELLLRSLGAVRVLCQPDDPEVVLDRYDRRTKTILVGRDDLPGIWRFYEDHGRRFGWIRADRLPGVLPGLSEWTLSHTEGLSPYPAYVGRRWPRILLVGGCPPGRRAERSAFCPEDPGGVSAWLLGHLAALPDLRIGLCRADDPAQDLGALWLALDRPPTVALGAEASTALRDLLIPHGRVHHPRWAMQTRSKYTGDYFTDLKDAIDDQQHRQSVSHRRHRLPASA